MPGGSRWTQHRDALIQRADKVLQIALEQLFAERTDNPDEPHIVGVLAQAIGTLLGEAWAMELARTGARIRVSTAFVHGRPIVDYVQGTKGCELGDLLVFHRHTLSTSGYREARALLLQAKRKSRLPARIPKNEQHQLYLYLHWPEFRYESGPLKSRPARRVRPQQRHLGAQYLVVQKSAIASRTWRDALIVSESDPELAADARFSEALVDLLLGRTGRQVAVAEPAVHEANEDGWSSTIWDLLWVSANPRRGQQRVFGQGPDGDVLIPLGQNINLIDPSLQIGDDPVRVVEATSAAGDSWPSSEEISSVRLRPSPPQEGESIEDDRRFWVVRIETEEEEASDYTHSLRPPMGPPELDAEATQLGWMAREAKQDFLDME